MADVSFPSEAKARQMMRVLAEWLRQSSGGPDTAPDDPDFDALFHIRLRHRIAVQMAGLAVVLELHLWNVTEVDDDTRNLLEALRQESHELGALLKAIKDERAERN